MRWFHVIEPDELMSPRRGLFITRYQGKTERIELVLAVTLPWRTLSFYDYRRLVGWNYPSAWCRLSLFLSRWNHTPRSLWERFRFERAAGIAPGEPIGKQYAIKEWI